MIDLVHLTAKARSIIRLGGDSWSLHALFGASRGRQMIPVSALVRSDGNE
jgi:hypothetical protein